MPGVQKLRSSAHPTARLALRGIEGSDKGALKPSEHHRVGRPLIPLEKNYNDQGFSRSKDWCLSVSWDSIKGSLKPHNHQITIVPWGFRGPSNGPPLNGETWVSDSRCKRFQSRSLLPTCSLDRTHGELDFKSCQSNKIWIVITLFPLIQIFQSENCKLHWKFRLD